MIVQSAQAGKPRLVISMAEHTAFAGQLARAFGNDRFEAVEPEEQMFYLVDHHDRGWTELDRRALMDPSTRLPYHLVDTPLEEILKTSAKSPALNADHHPYCGLLSSMHTWGLYNGRYGLSDKVLLDSISEEMRPRVDAMLEGELERQKELKAKLATDSKTAAWIEEPPLMQNYKQLQFFDTVALYFQIRHDEARGDEVFEHVPRNARQDVAVSVHRVEPEVYSFSPFPFQQDGTGLSFTGRYATPLAEGDSRVWDVILASLPVARQTVRLVAG